MPKQTARARAMASGELVCLAHPDGRLAHPRTKQLLRGSTDAKGYAGVEIGGKKWKVHRIIALAFIMAPLITLTAYMAYQIDHGAAGKLCNAVSNLRVLTSKEHHKVTAERARASGENPWAKMGQTQGRACEYRKVGEDEWTRCASREEASRQTGVSMDRREFAQGSCGGDGRHARHPVVCYGGRQAAARQGRRVLRGC